MTDEEIEEWLAGPNFARTSTLNDDGTPRVTAHGTGGGRRH
ncbi:MAG: pyridoxamine 5'-phosphate oxidase family protein [Chloroflexi bacterium]|nr:pyridoxamine 5'-phosphate oxidase family protein [Chloroflexota bacterium]